MAYVTSNPPALLMQTISGGSVWVYKSADDDATVNGASYFSNGKALGMKVGDIVFVEDTTTPKSSVCYVSALGAAAATTSFAAVA